MSGAWTLKLLSSPAFWCDGVPFNSDRSMTLETISLNIFGQGNLRMPVAACPKEFVAKEQTFEDLFEIIQWSFKHLATGILPSCRHDGRPFDKTDVYRKRLAGEELPLRAALAEFRADWSCYADVLALFFLEFEGVYLLEVYVHPSGSQKV